MGPGTELKRLLSRFSIRSKGGCKCDQRALIMDEEGEHWCKQNVSVIIGWLREEAEARNLPFFEAPAKVLIYTAIRSAGRKRRLAERL